MFRRMFPCLALILCTAASAAAQPAVFLVRHAERADTGTAKADDPELSKAGFVRAASLADALKDANITAIFATEFKRTQQTAAPLAKALGLTVATISSKDTSGLLARLKQSPGNVLVVGHSNSVPDVIKGLGVATPVTIDEADFDNLFIVVRTAKPKLLRLHYR